MIVKTTSAAQGSDTMLGSSLDSTNFDSLILRLYAAVDVLSFWKAVQAILNEALPNDACTRRDMALLSRLHPHIETTLQHLSTIEPFDCRQDRAECSTVHEPLDLLTPAERQIVQLVREGCSNKEIASRLCKSVRTVKTQCTSVYRKFGVRSRSRLLATLVQSRVSVLPGSEPVSASVLDGSGV